MLEKKKQIGIARQKWIDSFNVGKIPFTKLVEASQTPRGNFLKKLRVIDLLPGLTKKDNPRLAKATHKKLLELCGIQSNKHYYKYNLGWLFDKRNGNKHIYCLAYLIGNKGVWVDERYAWA
jgi:hypothetical protein